MKRAIRKILRSRGLELLRVPAVFADAITTEPVERPYHWIIARDAMLPRKGQPTIGEERFLFDLARDLTSPGPIVEIGTLFGASTRVLAMAKDRNRPLLTVDDYSWNPLGLTAELHEALTRGVLEDLVQTEGLTIVRAEKGDFFGSFAGPAPAMVFLDADHSYEETLKDIDWSLAIGARLICGHDYSDEFEGVKRAVHERGGPTRRHESLWVL